jgi:branched-chain amino acid transport system substrate-binding protein
MRKSILNQVREALGGKTAIKIGVIASRLGPLDYYGKMQIQGLELGIEYATNSTWQVADRKIEILIEEDASEPGMGGQKARSLIEDQGVDILQGATSSAVTIVIAKIAHEYERILMVEPAAADSITGTHFNQYVFRTAANVSQDAAAAGRYAVDHLGSSFAFIAPDYIWGHQSTEAWKRVIEAHGGKTLIEILAPTKTEDFKPYLEEILAHKPDVLVQSWAGAGYRALFSDMRDLGVFDKMSVTGGLGDREARHALGLDAVGIVGAIKYSPILPANPVNDWLRSKHKERHGDDPDLFTGGGFAAGVALIEGLNRTGGNPDGKAMISALTGMSFEGPKGTYTFRPEDHQAMQPMYIVKMVPDPDHPWAIPELIQEMSPEESSPPLKVPSKA